MPKLLHFTSSSAMLNNTPKPYPGARGSRQAKIVWGRRFDAQMAKIQEPESLVLHCAEKIESRLPRELFWPGRTVLAAGSITEPLADIVVDLLHNLSDKDPKTPIVLWIASPGGEIDAGLKIRDAIQGAQSRVITVGVGGVSSMAAFLVSSANKPYRRNRFALGNSIFMWHQACFSEEINDISRRIIDAGKELDGATEILYRYLAESSRRSQKYIRELLGMSDAYFNSRDTTLQRFIDGVIQPSQDEDGNPAGCEIVYHRLPEQRTRTRDIDKSKKRRANKRDESLKESPLSLTLRSYLTAMRSYKLMGKILANFALYPERDIRFKILNSLGGSVDEAFGLLQVIDQFNALSGCGNVETLGGGTIGGMPVLLLSAGKPKKIYSDGKLIIRGVYSTVPGGTPGEGVLEMGGIAQFFENLIFESVGAHSNASANLIRRSVYKGIKKGKEGFEMNAKTARELGIVNEIRKKKRVSKKSN